MTERQVQRGFLANIEVVPALILTFQFNPETMTDNKAVTYADGRVELCGNAPGKVYTGGGHRTITFSIQLHGLEEGSNGVSTELAKLRSFLYPKVDAWSTVGQLFGGEEGGRRMTAPPTCIFGFGTKILECVVTELEVNETQFNSLLAPVRAEVKVTLTVNEEDGGGLYELDKQRRNWLAQNISIV